VIPTSISVTRTPVAVTGHEAPVSVAAPELLPPTAPASHEMWTAPLLLELLLEPLLDPVPELPLPELLVDPLLLDPGPVPELLLELLPVPELPPGPPLLEPVVTPEPLPLPDPLPLPAPAPLLDVPPLLFDAPAPASPKPGVLACEPHAAMTNSPSDRPTGIVWWVR
jgi:hypothetical protein